MQVSYMGQWGRIFERDEWRAILVGSPELHNTFFRLVSERAARTVSDYQAVFEEAKKKFTDLSEALSGAVFVTSVTNPELVNIFFQVLSEGVIPAKNGYQAVFEEAKKRFVISGGTI